MFVCQDRGRSYLNTPSHGPLVMPTGSPLPRQQVPINRILDLKIKQSDPAGTRHGRSLGMSTFPVWKPRRFFRAAIDRPLTDERVKMTNQTVTGARLMKMNAWEPSQLCKTRSSSKEA